MLTALLREHAGAVQESSLQDLKRFIVDKTEGNPFFMEEIVQTLVEQGALARGNVGAPLHTQSLADLRIPATIQGVLAARIDRLPPDEKALLQILAVIGKEFSLTLLKHVADQPEDDLLHQLSHLQTSEFIYERPVFPDIAYTFKHALTQEVAYSSVLQERRTALHDRIAQAIESLYSQTLDEHYNELAHHYSRSGNTLKAINYLQRAGQQAAQHSLYEEAVTHFTTALALLQSLSDASERAQQELTLQLSLAASLQATRGPSAVEVAAAYRRALTLCQQGGTPQQFFSVLRGLWVLHHVQADLAAARTLGAQLLEMAERAQDAALLVEAHRALGSTFLWQGDFPLARTHLEAAIALYDQHQHQSLTLLYGGANPGVSCLCEIARVLWFLGYPEQALRRSQEALALARSLSDPFSLGFASVFAAGLHQLRREGSLAQSRAEGGIRVAREYGFSSLLSAGTIRRGWALAAQGQEEAGLSHMQQGLAARQATGAELAQPSFLALEAEVYGKLGQSEHALSLLSKALTTMTTSGEYRLEAEFYRLKGELMLQQARQRATGNGQQAQVTDPRSLIPDAQSEAAACFLKAIEIAQRQQAKSLELRAVMSLARLRQQQATQQESRVTQHETRIKLNEARTLLADVYNWFTEGFDTKDLQEAKTLLESLASSVSGTA
jgi:predicted ATPase